jgi:arabinofuranosyltransferase
MSLSNHSTVLKAAWALLLVAAGSLCVWLLLGMPETGIDDADIFLVYARNFSEGHGFVYNIGGERVEGFTSMLWVLMCSGLFRVFQCLETPLLLLNVLFGAGALFACMRHFQHRALFFLLLAAAPAWFAWSQVTLMESGLWCLLLTVMVLAVAEQRSGTVAVVVALLVLTRPESMLWGPWAILILGVGVASSSGWKSGLKAMLLPAASFSITLAGLVAFRMHYFGYPVPNTYYAKVSPDLGLNLYTGFHYLIGFFFQ